MSRRGGAGFINEEFFSPYQRIIPMHLTIIFGTMVVFVLRLIGITATLPVLVLILVLKTYADLSTHAAKHAGMGLVNRFPEPK